jgi:hypothetical protein
MQISFKGNKSLLAIFCIVFLTHFLSKVCYITDSRWTLHTSWAMVHHRNMQLDQFRETIEKNNFYAIDERDGHLYYSFPPGTSLLCAPLLAVMDKAAKRVYYLDVSNLLGGYAHQGMELFLAAFILALTAVLLFVVLKQFEIDTWLNWLLIIAFAYGTSAWSVASRGLFAHGPSMLFLTGTIWALNKSKQNENWLWLAGFLLGFSYIIRPTNSVGILAFGLYILYTYRFECWRAIVPGGLVLLLFVLRNYAVYGNILSPYYQPSHMGNDNHLLQGIAGNLFSPNRGLFIFSPFFLLLLPLLYTAFKQRALTPLLYTVIATVVLHTLLISYFNNWYAGWCFGPRYFADVLPLMMILMAVGLQAVVRQSTGVYRATVLSAFSVLALISCGIHYKGANDIKTEQWNYIPNNIDDNRGRVWDWNDIQFLR